MVKNVSKQIVSSIMTKLLIWKSEFKEMMSSVHRLLDQIEAYRMPSLPAENAAPQTTTAPDSGFPGLGGSSTMAP